MKLPKEGSADPWKPGVQVGCRAGEGPMTETISPWELSPSHSPVTDPGVCVSQSSPGLWGALVPEGPQDPAPTRQRQGLLAGSHSLLFVFQTLSKSS